jgi:hypothetical protein
MPRWHDTARTILDVIEAGYSEGGTALPARRYVSPGAPAYDCDQVTVHLVRTYSYEGRVTVEVPAPVGDRDAHTLALRAGVYEITIVRCLPPPAPSGAPPAAARLEEAAVVILDDAERVPLLLAAAAQAMALNAVALGGWTSIGGSGGLGGGRMLVTIGV